MQDLGPEKNSFYPPEILDQRKFNILLARQVAEAARNTTGLTLIMLTPDIDTPSDDETRADTEKALKSAMQMAEGGNIGVVEPGKYGIILPKLDPAKSIATIAVLLQTVSTLLFKKGFSFTPAVGVAFYHHSDGSGQGSLYGRAFDALTHAQKEGGKIAVVLKPKQKISLDPLREDIQKSITLIHK